MAVSPFYRPEGFSSGPQEQSPTWFVTPVGQMSAVSLAVSAYVKIPDGTNAIPSVASATDPTTGMYFPSSATIAFTSAGTVNFAIGGGNLNIVSSGVLGWASGSPLSTVDTKLARDAANTLALRNGTTAQAFYIYNTFTSASVFEAFSLAWSGNILYATTRSTGGTVRAAAFGTEGAANAILRTNATNRWEVDGTTGNLLATTDGGPSVGDGTHNALNLFTYTATLKPGAFASLPAVPSNGMCAVVTDSNTSTWGATVAGGGANKVLVYYNGTNWTCAGK